MAFSHQFRCFLVRSRLTSFPVPPSASSLLLTALERITSICIVRRYSPYIATIMPPKRKQTKKTKAEAETPEPDSTVNPPKPMEEKEEGNVEVEEEVPKRGRRAAAAKKENGTKEEKPVVKKKEKKVTKRGAAANAKEPEVAEEEEKKVDDEETAVPEVPYEPKKRRVATKSTEKSESNGKSKAKPADTAEATEANFNCSKKNSEGKLANFKIASWNVAGLKAWLSKDGLAYVTKENPDIFCMQETKCNEDTSPEEVKDFDGYKKYWASSEKKGYAGVSLFSKVEPISVKIGIDHDLDEEGRCITAEYEKFYLVAVYVPNAGRKLVTLDKRLEWNKAFKDYIEHLDKKKPVIICGDMNVAHSEIDLANPKTNKKNAGFTQEERDGMTDFLGSGFVDTFRKLYPEEVRYTFWTYMAKSRAKNVGWRLDYFIVSERMMDKVCDTDIRTEILGSDHCPIILHINV